MAENVLKVIISRTAPHAKVNEPQKAFHGKNSNHRLKWVGKEQRVSVHSRCLPKGKEIFSVVPTVIIIFIKESVLHGNKNKSKKKQATVILLLAMPKV